MFGPVGQLVMWARRRWGRCERTGFGSKPYIQDWMNRSEELARKMCPNKNTISMKTLCTPVFTITSRKNHIKTTTASASNATN